MKGVLVIVAGHFAPVQNNCVSVCTDSIALDEANDTQAVKSALSRLFKTMQTKLKQESLSFQLISAHVVTEDLSVRSTS